MLTLIYLSAVIRRWQVLFLVDEHTVVAHEVVMAHEACIARERRRRTIYIANVDAPSSSLGLGDRLLIVAVVWLSGVDHQDLMV